ncbi:5-formyltetrahydrofolate cyclo-ligase [Companilactobacillus sp. DQM5]|uniref:5-formyltetrahydrofolate cyclo-ligase n=1 Tax=Companilactobacillus sp. DQM5 TaxID=3463359 RepID=UPI004057DB36
MEKKEFRKRQIQILNEFFKTDEYKKESEILYNKLFTNEKFLTAKSIGVTISMGFELDTNPIILKSLELNKEVYIPKTVTETKDMDFYQFNSYEELRKTKFGVLEPVGDTKKAIPDLLIVPGLAFIKKTNYRLGFGAGFYDRYLRKNNPETLSLVNSKQLYNFDNWGVEEFDIPVKKIITYKED